MELRQLDPELVSGKPYSILLTATKYLDLELSQNGYQFTWKDYDTPQQFPLEDQILAEWLDDPIGYGLYEQDELIGFVEGYLEKWNNRFRITNIIILKQQDRHLGLGKQLMDQILIEAKKKNARMVVLETQTFNYPAISFYQKCGFEITGFDLYAYSNTSIEDHNIYIIMTKKL